VCDYTWGGVGKAKRRSIAFAKPFLVLFAAAKRIVQNQGQFAKQKTSRYLDCPSNECRHNSNVNKKIVLCH